MESSPENAVDRDIVEKEALDEEILSDAGAQMERDTLGMSA